MNDDFDKLMSERIREQEEIHPSYLPARDVLWERFREKHTHQKVRKSRVAGWAAAAVLVLTIGSAYFLRHDHSNAPRKQIAQTTFSAKEQEAFDFIARYCGVENISCNTPVVQQLRDDLTQSFRRLEEIDLQLRMYGDDADLVRAKARIESHQARLIKSIIKTL